MVLPGSTVVKSRKDHMPMYNALNIASRVRLVTN